MKLIPFSEKQLKYMELLPIHIKLLNHRNWESIAEGMLGLHAKFLLQVFITSLKYFGNVLTYLLSICKFE